ncbi:MAG: histidine phosphatase family protein [Elusimicrobia bacterium]|nr:histidine phosphatase family protein [Elusimicrobiota bacterium]
MKQIVLLRHGQALSFSESGTGEDSKRPLSETGKDQAAAAAKKLLELEFLPEIVIASPYLRAAETAAIASSFFPETRHLNCEALACGDSSAVIELLALELKTAASALIVGHQPLLGTLGGFLLRRESFNLAPGGFIYLKTAWLPPAPPVTLACSALGGLSAAESELVEFFPPVRP